MASMTPAVISGKPSFAKVAAMAPPQKVAQPPSVSSKLAAPQKDMSGVIPTSSSSPSGNAITASTEKPTNQSPVLPAVAAIGDGLEKLGLVGITPSQRSPNALNAEPIPTMNGADEHRSHLSSSSTKPASFGTKSTVSENTFALDEKESLRPDDSASVQATDEDESFFGPPVSNRPNSQMVLDGHHSSLRRPTHDGPVTVCHAAPRHPLTLMANPPRFGDIMPNMPPVYPQNGTPLTSFATNPNGADSLQQYSPASMSPDERLVEAMGTPKDRLLLLQLEEKFLAFIAQSKDATLDLPPQNSYERLLAHKLADYYNLAHYSPADSNWIRLYKAVEFRLPVPLSELARGAPGSDTLPTGAAAVKIMRRTVLAGNKVFSDGSTAASSSIPSKSTSEAGAENTSDEGVPSPPDTISSKDRSKWTREEKEAHYKAARERIFRDFEEAQPAENTTADTSIDMSRSSSTSGKKKGHKQKTPKDDSFEARSSYVPGFLGMPYSSQNQYNGSYGNSGYQLPYAAQTPVSMPAMTYGSNAAPVYNNQYEQPAAFPGGGYSATYPGHCTPNDGWSNPQSPQPGGYYNITQQPGPLFPGYGPVTPSPANQYRPVASPAFNSPAPQWGIAQYQQPFQAQPPTQATIGQNGNSMHWPGYPPHPGLPSQGGQYQFGQTAFPQYSTTTPNNNQHPLPGSYSRPTFNPQTRSFVPGVPNMRMGGQAGQGRGFSPTFAAQGENGSQNADKVDPSARAPPAPNRTQESLQKKWGTPAHLPKKPPPSQVPPTFEVDNTPPHPSQTSFSPLASSIAKGSTSVGNG